MVFKGTILQRYYSTFVKFDGNKFGSHMTVLYPNLCYNKMYYLSE